MSTPAQALLERLQKELNDLGPTEGAPELMPFDTIDMVVSKIYWTAKRDAQRDTLSTIIKILQEKIDA